MTSNPMITKEDLRKIHLYCYEDVQEFLSIHKTLDEEIEKSEAEMDKALVEECLKYVEVVMGEDDDVDEEKLDAKYKEVLARAEQTQSAQPAKVIKSKKRAVRKFFFILAATITVLFTTLTIAAKICGYDNAWEFVYQKAIEIMELEPGEAIEEENITMIHNGKFEKFASIEEFLEKESLDIFYPQPLPNGLEVKTIRKYSFEDGKWSCVIKFNDTNTSLLIHNHLLVDLSTVNYLECHTYGEATYYVKMYPDNIYQAICQVQNFQYTITARDYETLMLLLQNMKGT